MQAGTPEPAPATGATDWVYASLEERASAAELPNQVRQERIESMLIRYPGFVAIQDGLRSFHRPVAGGGHGRGEIGGLLGTQRAGKSTAIRDYVAGLGSVETDEAVVPVALYVDAGESWTSRDLGVALGRALLPGLPQRGSIETLFGAVVAEVVQHGVELVIVDDAQNLLGSKFRKTVDDTLGLAISLAETRRCNVLFAGTPDVEMAVRQNKHAEGRGSFPHWTVRPYDWADPEGREHFRFLLDDIDERLPFRGASNLADPGVAAHFYRLSGGLIGIVMNYVRAAAFLAINEGADHVTPSHLLRAAANRRRVGDGYVPFEGRLTVEQTLVPDLRDDRPDDGVEAKPPPTLSKRRTRSGIR